MRELVATIVYFVISLTILPAVESPGLEAVTSAIRKKNITCGNSGRGNAGKAAR